MNSRPQPRQIPPFLYVPLTFPILELISLALFLSLAALCSKSVRQSLSNQSLPHSFSRMPGCIGLLTQKSQVKLEVTPSENLTTEDQHERTIHQLLFHQRLAPLPVPYAHRPPLLPCRLQRSRWSLLQTCPLPEPLREVRPIRLPHRHRPRTPSRGPRRTPNHHRPPSPRRDDPVPPSHPVMDWLTPGAGVPNSKEPL